MLLRRRRLPLDDLMNLSSSTSVLTRLNPAARRKLRTSPSAGSSSSIGSSTAPNTRCPPPRPPLLSAAAVIKVKDKSTRELQRSSSHSKKINKISKPKVKTGDVFPSASSPPSKKTRKTRTREKLKGRNLETVLKRTRDKPTKVTREEVPHMEPLELSSGEPLPSQDFIVEQTRMVTREDPAHMEPLEQSSGEPLPSQDFIDEQRAYFAEIGWRSLFHQEMM